MLIATGCAKRKPVVRVPPPPPSIGTTETGVASWYGIPYHGRHAANGEIYDMKQLTAAHRTLPFGTWVKVENLTNNKTVTVRITDRGPFVDGRIIDLSLAAARAIDMVGSGIARVRVEIVEPPPQPPSEDLFAVQVGAFQDKARADRLRAAMEKQFGAARLAPGRGDPPLWRVLVGQEPTLEAAQSLADRIRGQQTNAPFVVRLDEGAPSVDR